MTISQAVILGAVQGITEFFPISSSGHLAALQAFFGIKEPGIADSIMIGISRGIAIISGISRSGATIASGILSGVEKASAVRFAIFSGYTASRQV